MMDMSKTTKSNVVPVLEDLAQRINEEHSKAETTFKAAMDHAMKAGELLAEAKAAVPQSRGCDRSHCAVAKRSGTQAGQVGWLSL